MSKKMFPDQIMKALDLAEFVVAKEKKDRIGSSDACVLPMKFFLFHDHKSITGLIGSPFEQNDFDVNEQMSLAVRLFALALDAQAVLHVTEGWVATRCASCGIEKAGVTKEGQCVVCGNKVLAPSENPYAEEMLICTLSIKDHKKTFFWMSRFERDDDNTIVGFENHLQCEPMDATGRFMQVWELESWMGPHFAVNYPMALQAIGRPVDEQYLKVARIAQEMAPPDYPFIRLKVDGVEAVMTSMKLKRAAEGH